MESHANHQNVQVFIDRKEYSSPNPTTGSALYILGHVKDGYDLFEEEHGRTDDKLIANNGHEIRLKEFAHFYSAQRDLNPGCGGR
jgi:hypothetical protein